ncbi:MAG: aminotransferase class I/II-fold pyridoxal phosphate-dependent enzyme [Planctomycetes bacterium]|nr:aminotransferase class I/II-fold pyridoxal phosphate-dependent enzyme [Planctomycetota bacterium]
MQQVTHGPFDWPIADEEVRVALEEAYQDGSWGRYHGPHCEGLAEDLCERFACQKVLLCSSGTVGVELALRGFGAGPGDEVVLAGYDFPGNFRAIEAVGARPVLVDVDPATWCLDAELLESVGGEKIKAVIVSHLHGGLADMPRIMAIANQRGWSVVEDACQQPGASLGGRPVGSWGDAGVLSFGGSKLLTAGRGGAVLTSDAQVFQRMKIYADRGNQAFPLSELQAAVLRPQLKKLDLRNQVREQRVAEIRQATTELSEWLRPVVCRAATRPTYYKFAWSFVAAETRAELRDELIAQLQTAGAPLDAGFRGFARRSERRCRKHGLLAWSERLSQSTLVLHHPVLLAHKKAALQVGQVLNHMVGQLVS